MPHASRIKKLQFTLESHNAYCISDRNDLFYLTGFVTLTPEEREAFLLVTPQTSHLFLSAFSFSPKVAGIEQMEMSYTRPLSKSLQELIDEQKLSALLVDCKSLNAFEYLELSKKLTDCELIDMNESTVAKHRQIKDSSELSALRTANTLTHRAINETLSQIKVGQSEQEVCEYLELSLRKHGVKQMSFPTIVAFGSHTAIPHHQPTDRTLKKNEAVLIDCGAKWQQYCADMTRTIWFGDSPDEEFNKIEKAVQQAYDATVAKLQKGKERESRIKDREVNSEGNVSSESNHKPQNTTLTPDTRHLTPNLARDLDMTARSLIDKSGYGKQFIHTTGHGVGLYIHEQPSISWKNETKITPGMVITIEPGIYLEGKFGYRHENSVYVKEDGYEELGLEKSI